MLSLQLRTLAIVMCATLLPMARAQSPAAGAATTYTVQGVVLNSLTHEPIARALVESNSAAMLTDGEGHFELNLPEGMTQISVRRPGFNSRGLDASHAVNVTASTPALTFTLTPEASITGHVTLSTGEPADSITFMAYTRALADGHERWNPSSSAATDSEGTFRMSNLETPGIWVICSVAQQEHDGLRAVRSQAPAVYGYPSECFPGPIPASSGSAPANALALAPGQQADIDIALIRQPFYRVAIAVPSLAGSEAIDIQIHESNGRTLSYSSQWNAASHLSEAYLPSGQYYAEAYHRKGQEAHSEAEQWFGEMAHAFAGTLSYGRADFRVGAAPLTGVSMNLLPLHPIPVEIHKEFTAPTQSGVRNEFTNEFARQANNPGINLTLIEADSAAADPSGSSLTPRPGSSDGSLFQIEAVVPGRYWVRTNPYEGYVASITSGSADLNREPLEIGPGSATAPIHVTLRNDGGQIQCTLIRPQSDDPASGTNGGEMTVAWVYAVPTSQTASQIPQAQGILQRPDPVIIANLAPGTYRVVAYDRSQEIDLNSPQQLAEIASKGQTVTVTPGATVSIQIELIHTASASPSENSEAGPVN